MVQTENKSEHTLPPAELTSPIRNTSENHSTLLNSCTLRGRTQLFDPYK